MTPARRSRSATARRWPVYDIARRNATCVRRGRQGPNGPWRSNTEAQYLLQELESIHANLSPRTQRLAGALRSFLARRVPLDNEQEWDLSRSAN